MDIEDRESGLALIVTLLLGLIAAAVIGTLMYLMTTGTWISGMQARYTSSLEAAIGGASFIQQRLGSYDLQCRDASGNPCFCDYLQENNDGQQMKCPTNSSSWGENASVVMDSAGELGDYNVVAVLTSVAFQENGTVRVFSFDLTARPKRNTEERSNIEFVYKVE